MFNIVLYSPQIPPNTGNIARLCAATKSKLHLIRPLGFRIDDYAVKRAGLDYWEFVEVIVHESLDKFLETAADAGMFLFSKRGRYLWNEVSYKPGDYLIFGSETEGLPEDFMRKYSEKTIRIPHATENVRSLNLAVSAGIILYEAIRQNMDDFNPVKFPETI